MSAAEHAMSALLHLPRGDSTTGAGIEGHAASSEAIDAAIAAQSKMIEDALASRGMASTSSSESTHADDAPEDKE